jgi:hypothetical protein
MTMDVREQPENGRDSICRNNEPDSIEIAESDPQPKK